MFSTDGARLCNYFHNYQTKNITLERSGFHKTQNKLKNIQGTNEQNTNTRSHFHSYVIKRFWWIPFFSDLCLITNVRGDHPNNRITVKQVLVFNYDIEDPLYTISKLQLI